LIFTNIKLNEPISIENLLRDWSILYPPTSTPLNGVSYSRRYPCGDTEKLKQTIRIFFLLRDLCLSVTNEVENQLPLTKQEYLVKENDALDLSINFNLIFHPSRLYFNLFHFQTVVT